MKSFLITIFFLSQQASAIDFGPNACQAEFHQRGSRVRLAMTAKPILEQLRDQITTATSRISFGEEQDIFERDRWMELANDATDTLLEHLQHLDHDGRLNEADGSIVHLVRFYLLEKDNPRAQRDTLMTALTRTSVTTGSRAQTFTDLWTLQSEKEWNERPH